MLMKYFFAILLILSSFYTLSQKVQIKSVEQKGQKIHITYDLQGDPGKYKVKLFVKKSYQQNFNKSSLWSSPLNAVSGDIGINQSVGSNKLIIWDVLKDRNEFQGDWIFGIEAVNTTKMLQQQKKSVRLTKKFNRKKARSLIAISSNITHNPFGLSYFNLDHTSSFGFYFDLRTDFRVWAPGEIGLRDRNWIINDMEATDTDIDIVSRGGNNLTTGISIPVFRKYNICLLNLGLGLSSIPVFDEFMTIIGPYYAKARSENKLNYNIGFIIQLTDWGLNFGGSYDTASPGINLMFGWSL